MLRSVNLNLECLADEKWQAEHQSRLNYPQCPSWRSVVEAIEAGDGYALHSCLNCPKARIVPTSFEPYPHQSAFGIDEGRGLSLDFYKSLSQTEDYRFLEEKGKLHSSYGYGYHYDPSRQATLEPPERERVTIADAIDKMAGELATDLQEVERAIYEWGDIDAYEPDEVDEADREEVDRLKGIRDKLERCLNQIEGLELTEDLLAKEITFSWKQSDDKPFAGGYIVNALKAIAPMVAVPKEQAKMLEVSDQGDRLIQIASKLETIE